MSFTFFSLNFVATTQELGSIENSSRESMDEMELEEDEPLGVSHSHPLCNQNQMSSPTDETDDGTIDDRVEYAVLLPDSFAVLDSTFNQHSL